MNGIECPGPNYVWDRVPCPERGNQGSLDCGVIHMGWVKLERPLADRVADLERAAQKPALTGEQVRAAVDEEFDSVGWVRTISEYPSDEQRAHAWDRVAARLAKP